MVNQERVILIKGDRSKWYDQAIFIMKKNIPTNKIPVDFVAEAERIISDRNGAAQLPGIGKLPADKPVCKNSSSGFDLFLNVVMLLGCLALAGILAYHYFA